MIPPVAGKWKLAAALLLLATAVLYWPVLGFRFLNWDDTWLIVENPLLRQPSWVTLGRIFGDFSLHTRMMLGAEYLPLRDLLSLADWNLWSGRPQGFHLTNLLLYLLNCALLIALARQAGVALTAALLGVLLFAVHPAHVESVAWISERKSLLANLFLLLSLWAYWRGGKSLVLAVAAFVAAGLSKSYTLVFPLILAGYEWTVGRSLEEDPGWRKLRRLSPFFVLGLLLFVVHWWVGSRVGMVAGRSGGALAAALLPFSLLQNYLALTIVPLSSAVFLPLTDEALTLGLERCGGMILLGAALWAFWYWRRRRPWLAFSLAWFLLSLLPFLQLVPLQNILAWRYLYPASAALAFVFFQQPAAAGWRWRTLALVLLAVSILLAVQTRRQLWRWHDSETFWKSAILRGENHPAAWRNLAAAIESQQLPQRSWAVALAWAQAKGQDPEAQLNLAQVFFLHGDSDGAIILTRGVISRWPGEAAAWNNLGYYLMQRQQWAEADTSLRRALALRPDYVRALHNLGLTARRQGRPDLAASYFQQAWRADRSYFPPAYSWAALEEERGRKDAACRVWQAILEEEPLEQRARQQAAGCPRLTSK